MDDVGTLCGVVGIGVFHAELLSQQHIDLDGNQSVFLAVYVAVLDVQLGAVEGRLVDTDGVFQTQVVQNLGHGVLGCFPLLCSALVLVLGVCGIPLGEAEGTVLQQTYGLQEVLCQLQTALEFLFQLLGTKHVVTLGDGELTNTDQAVHLAGILVTEQGRGLGKAHGKIAVGALLVQIDLILEGAGHGTHCEAFLLLVVGVANDKHAVQIVIPVTGNAVKVTLCHQRSLGEKTALLLLYVLNPALQQLNHSCALGQQNGQALTDGIHGGEVLQLSAQLVVIALLSLFLGNQIAFQVFLVQESGTVDTGEHLTAGVASPVCTGSGGKLECLDLLGVRYVGACAEIGEIPLLVEGKLLVLGEVAYQLDLVGLVLHQLQSLCSGQGEALDLEVCLDDRLHFCLDGLEMLCGQGLVATVEIIVKAVIDGRTDGQLYVGKKMLDGLRQNVRAGMSQRAQFVVDDIAHND